MFAQVHQSGSGWSPVVSYTENLPFELLAFNVYISLNHFNVILCVYVQYVEENLAVMSIGFLLSSPDDAVIWRGPKKNGTRVCAFVT